MEGSIDGDFTRILSWLKPTSIYAVGLIFIDQWLDY